MKVVAISDLGGLGAKEGPPGSFTWTTPNLMPPMLPWLAVLVLLGLKPNRSAQAWWIWLPLGLVLILRPAVASALGFVPSAVQAVFTEVAAGLAIGVAAVWLLSARLGWKHRGLVFLAILGSLLAFGTLNCWAMTDWSEESLQALQMEILLALSALVLAVAVSLAGWCCRRRYRPLGLLGWLILWLVTAWTVVTLPFAVVVLVASQGAVAWNEVAGGILAAALVCFAVLMPFFILSFASPLYRERLRGLLHLGGQPVAPPIVVEEPAPGMAS